MTYATERENFLLTMQTEGMAPEIARRILRRANTYQRLTMLACNGDRRPYVECPLIRTNGTLGPRSPLEKSNGQCLCGVAAGSQHEQIPPVKIELARAERVIREWCGKASQPCHKLVNGLWSCKLVYGHTMNCQPGVQQGRFVPIFHGDPRGDCVKLKVPSGKTDDWEREGICVPTPCY